MCHTVDGGLDENGKLARGNGDKRSGGMLTTLAVCYLFLGGAGAGAIAVSSLIDLVWVKQPFGCAAYVQGPQVSPVARTVDFGFASGLALLTAGVMCLLFDLGRADRALSLFFHPQFTMLTLGAYALAALMVLGICAVAVRFMYLPSVSRGAVVAVECAACIVGIIVMLYTGLLLQSVQGVAFWATPFVPALFVLSSASSGIAVVLVLSCFIEWADCPFSYGQFDSLRRWLVRADVAIIVFEGACAAGLLLWASESEHFGVALSFESLVHGDQSVIWWVGFIVFGLCAPLVAEIAHAMLFHQRRQRALSHAAASSGSLAHGHAKSASLVAAAALLVLVGALCLRWSLADAGAHREPELESASVSASEIMLSGAALSAPDRG